MQINKTILSLTLQNLGPAFVTYYKRVENMLIDRQRFIPVAFGNELCVAWWIHNVGKRRKQNE